MFRLSARKVVILAAICFTGLVIMQVAWMQAAYEGEAALYAKAKKQYESELPMELARDAQLKKGLQDLVDHYRQTRGLSAAQTDWFHFNLAPAIYESPKRLQLGVYVDGISIVQHQHEGARKAKITTLVSNIFENPDSSRLAKAGKVCIHCILEEKKELHDEGSFELLLFYRDQDSMIFDKLGLLIAGSLLLLIVLGLLFREIIRRHRQEKKLSEAKNDFINNLTHELQTPVFAIQMANRLIKEKTAGQSDIAPLTTIVDKETSQLKQHATKILELASLENAQVELHLEKVDVNQFIREKVPTIELLLQGKGGKVDVHFAAGELYAGLDRTHFNNVLVSLTDNAIKYNSRQPELVIETGQTGNRIFVSVRDNGMGIEPAYLPYVFDKFYRAPNVKRAGMTAFGLGLSYVKQITGMHKGQVEISSEPGTGTKVTILLPKWPANA